MELLVDVLGRVDRLVAALVQRHQDGAVLEALIAAADLVLFEQREVRRLVVVGISDGRGVVGLAGGLGGGRARHGAADSPRVAAKHLE